MANELINITKEIATSISSPVEFVKTLTLSQKTQLLTILKLWNRETKKDKESNKINFIKALENDIYASTLENWNVTLPDGTIWEAKVVRAKNSTKIEKKIINDFEKAIAYAKEHNLHLPMTERVIIEPQVDLSKIEMEDWYQENADKFVRVEYIEKESNGSNNLRFKEIKKEVE